jgi:DnaK suppressor protein
MKKTKKATASKPKPLAKPKAAKKAVSKAAPKKATPQKAAPKSLSKQKPAVKAVAPKASLSKPAFKAPPLTVPSKHPKGKIPVSKETPGRTRLNKEELKYFEQLLNEKKETLIQELDYLEDNSMRLNAKDGAGDLSSHAYHLADHATETQDREQAFHMASREGRYLFYIEEALDRVRAGTYGLCKNCGKLILKARLEAVPTAKMCIDCKTKQEQAVEVEDPA